MKQFLVAAVVLTIISFIAAQSPPLVQPQTCVSANATGLCSASWTYVIKSGSDLIAATAAAQANYDANVAKFANATQACKDALTVFACQSNLPRCGRYQNYGGVVKTRCDNVNTACGISGFPSNFTGNACIVNSAASVDGPALVCYNSQYGTLGAACTTNMFDPAVQAATTFTACPPVSSCNTTTTSTCVAPNKIGDACVSSCVTGTAQPGSLLTCSAGTCQYTGKRFGLSCTGNSECLSGNCTAGKCLESPLFGPCTSSLNCQQNLYCDTKNNTCYNIPVNGELCGFVQPNWSNVPCNVGFTCVRTSNATSRCAPNANIGQVCSDATGANVYDNALCSPPTLSIQGTAKCTNGICAYPTYRAINEPCNSTNICNPTTATCSYPSGSTQGTCVAPASVACDSLSITTCNIGQRCNCAADTTQSGACAIDTTSPTVACAQQSLNLQQCLLTSCKGVTSAFFPYDGASCGATTCLAQVNAYFCCLKNNVGTNYVAPFGQPMDPCVTPTPTPGPTSTGGPSTTTVPFKSSRSGATTAVVSFIAMIIAAVAFCL